MAVILSLVVVYHIISQPFPNISLLQIYLRRVNLKLCFSNKDNFISQGTLYNIHRHIWLWNWGVVGDGQGGCPTIQRTEGRTENHLSQNIQQCRSRGDLSKWTSMLVIFIAVLGLFPQCFQLDISASEIRVYPLCLDYLF